MVGEMPTPHLAAFDPFTGPPQMHGARRVGVRPGTHLIHPLAVTGERPLRFEVVGLPDGLTVDGDGIVRGTAPAQPGDHELTVTASNALASISESVTLCVGDTLALTPPMGWNSWNVYGSAVSAEVVLAVAQAMVDTGMRDLGYSYINIDDFWHAAGRAADGRPLANPKTFPGGMAPVAERVHELGLKLGIYSDAAELTCGGCYGSLGHEQVDAEAYAEWGVDLLKYDYCHAPVGRDAAIQRYGAMGRALAGADRSIVFSVCEWGLRQPWRWAADLGGSYWRTTRDIFDSYSWLPLGVRGLAARNVKLNRFARPGHWNDPDMLLVGNRGRGKSTGELRLPKGPRPKVWSFRGITDVQAHSHMTLWSMMAAPLLTSHDLASTGEFDRRLLTNPEILAINQDELGVQARKVSPRFRAWVLAKPLVDGSMAVSITNMGRRSRRVRVPLSQVGWHGTAQVRDVWRMQDVGRLDRLDVELGPFASVAYVCRRTG